MARSDAFGGIALLGFFVMLIFGYGWHDITDAYSGDLEERDCNAVFAMPFGYSSKDIETCKNFEMSNFITIGGWIMIIGGIIGYIATSAGKPPKQREDEPKKESKESPPKTVEKVIVLCPKCDTRNEEDAEFCKKCGKRLRAKQGIVTNESP